MLADGLSLILWSKVDLEAGRQHQVYFILIWPMSNHALPSCGLIIQYSDSIYAFYALIKMFLINLNLNYCHNSRI